MIGILLRGAEAALASALFHRTYGLGRASGREQPRTSDRRAVERARLSFGGDGARRHRLPDGTQTD